MVQSIGESEVVQNLSPIHKVESSYCRYLQWLKLQKNKRNDLFEKWPGEVMVYDENSSFGAVKKYW